MTTTVGTPVKQFMRRPVVATTPRASVRDIAAQLVRGGFSGMPVTDRDGTILGVITEYDIVEAILDGKQLDEITARDIMHPDPITLDADADVSEALLAFKKLHILRVPITEDGKLVGILSRTDALRGLIDEPEFLVF